MLYQWRTAKRSCLPSSLRIKCTSPFCSICLQLKSKVPCKAKHLCKVSAKKLSFSVRPGILWLAAGRARAALHYWRHNNPPCWAEGRQQRRSLLPLPVAPLYFFSLHSTRCRHRRLRRHFRLLSSIQLAITPRSLHGPSPNLRPCPKSNARICSSRTNTTCLYAGRYRRSALGRMC